MYPKDPKSQGVRASSALSYEYNSQRDEKKHKRSSGEDRTSSSTEVVHDVCRPLLTGLTAPWNILIVTVILQDSLL
jgi:hypothetical protein